MPDMELSCRQKTVSCIEGLIKEAEAEDVVMLPVFETLKVLKDALELLKAQQKTPVVFKQFDGSTESECGNCGLNLDKTYSVCPKCGKELDWNA